MKIKIKLNNLDSKLFNEPFFKNILIGKSLNDVFDLKGCSAIIMYSIGEDRYTIDLIQFKSLETDEEFYKRIDETMRPYIL